MSGIEGRTSITGIGETEYTRGSGRSVMALQMEAALMAIRDAGLEPTDIDGVIIDSRGQVVSLWSSFAYQGGGELSQENKGVPVDLVREMLELVRDDSKAGEIVVVENKPA